MMTKRKVALITGGASGIGLAIARRFVKEGWTTVITGRDAEKLQNIRHELGDDCHAIQFDMTWLDRIPAFVAEVKSTFGQIDVLVNNAGINQKKPFLDVTREDFEQIVLVNQTALFLLTREVVSVMVNQEHKGTVVNISSMAAHYGIPKVISYTSTKAALEGMTRAMAVELSPLGIRVNGVAPGYIETPMTSRAFDNDSERKSRVLSRTPMGKLGTAEDVANAVYFLCAPEAGFITGEIIKVDGGNAIGF